MERAAHGRAGGTDHPAILRAAGHAGADALGLGAGPDGRPILLDKVADAQVGANVAGKDIPPGVEKNEIGGGGAGDEAVEAEDLFHQAEVEIGAEPVLDRTGAQHGGDEALDGTGDADAVIREVIALMELEAVVEGGGRQLDAHGAGEVIDGKEIGGVVILDDGGEPEIGAAKFFETSKTADLGFEPPGFPADGIVGRAETLEAEADLNVGVTANDRLETLGMETVGTDLEGAGAGIKDIDDLEEIVAEGGLTAGDVQVVNAERDLLERL